MKASERYRRDEERDEEEERQHVVPNLLTAGVFLVVVALYALFVGSVQLGGIGLGCGLALLVHLIGSATRASSEARLLRRRRSARYRR